MGYIDTEDVLKTHKLSFRGVDTTNQELLLIRRESQSKVRKLTICLPTLY